VDGLLTRWRTLFGDALPYSVKRTWVVIALGFIFLEGMAGQLLGPLLPTLQSEFGLSAGLAGLAGTVNTVGFVIAVVITGGILGHVRPKRGALIGLLGIVVALCAMISAPLYALFVSGLALRALGTGIVRGIDKPILSHLFPARRDRLLNTYELTWAVGAATAPLLATVAIDYTGWELAYVFVLLLTLPLVGLVVVTPLPVDAIDEQPLSLGGIHQLAGNSKIVGMVVALLLSGGIEGGLFLWMPTYLQEFVSPTVANLALSAYFLTYIPARIFHTLYAPRIGQLRILTVSGVGGAALLTYGFSVGTGLSAVVALAGAGFFIAGFFPLLSAYGIGAAPEKSGPVNGLSLGASFAGGSLTPPLIGLLIERYSIDVGVDLFAVYSIALGVVLIAMLAYERQQD